MIECISFSEICSQCVMFSLTVMSFSFLSHFFHIFTADAFCFMVFWLLCWNKLPDSNSLIKNAVIRYRSMTRWTWLIFLYVYITVWLAEFIDYRFYSNYHRLGRLQQELSKKGLNDIKQSRRQNFFPFQFHAQLYFHRRCLVHSQGIQNE